MTQSEAKKRKVLMVYPDFVENSTGTQLKGSYSEGIASISAVLKLNGHQVSLYHLASMVTKEEYLKRLQEEQADIITFSTWTSAYKVVKQLLVWTKELPNVFVVVGGYHATLAPDEVIADEGVDAICIGEGEYPLLDICERLTSPELLYQTESIWFNKDGQVIKNPVRPFIEDLDTLPPPDMELFDFDSFLSSRIKTAIVMVSRGCIFSCTYCANSKLRSVYPKGHVYARFKGARNAINYLKSILEKYPFIEYFNFMDSIINMNRKWFDEFIVLYAQEICIPFACRLRPDLLDEETARKLKEANCYLADIGIECGNQEIRSKYLNRKMTNETIEKSFSHLRKYKISTLCFNIVGLPYESIHNTLETIKLDAKVRPNKIVVSIFRPFPHTRLTEIAREAGFVTGEVDWEQEVTCHQPQYPDKQVLFAQHYFRFYVKLYKLAFKCPKWLGKPLEKFFDFTFTFKYKPHGLLVALHIGWGKLIHGLKRLLMKISPKFYIFLRNKSVKLKNNKNSQKKSIPDIQS